MAFSFVLRVNKGETYDRNDDISVKRIHANEVVDLRLQSAFFYFKTIFNKIF